MLGIETYFMFGIFSFPPMVSALKKVGEVQTSIPSLVPGVVWEFRKHVESM